MSGVQVLQGALNHQNLNSARKRPDYWPAAAKTASFRVELVFGDGSIFCQRVITRKTIFQTFP
ncbi:MAG TPA: hypothetical protein DD001_09055 [Microcoleaceae bacterium UBA10368]|nr:hypothetical protein [Microcoleaceae cyanobacterium UBA10368]HCV29879.1 hypothetical protein [Microcoleaceae cyanobacterium UBA9251]